MAQTKTTLILPVESQVRELDAKLLLACAAAERGFRVVLGSRAIVHHQITAFPRGVYLAKSMRSLSEAMFRILQQLGHEIVAWDEEALVRFPQDDYYRRRLSAEALGRVSHLFAWGEDDARLFREFPSYPGTPIHVTGNPRIDLLRPELRAYFERESDALRERYGDFVLVNTNFGFVNSFATRLNLTREEPGAVGGPVLGENTRGMRREFAAGLATHKRALFDHFRTVVPLLADAFPQQQIVIRPHPAEAHEPWMEVASGRANLHVRSEYGAVPWLISARALVHNGCTTAIEAAVLGTPSVAYTPIRAEDYDFALPNGLSAEASQPEELIKAVSEILATSPETAMSVSRHPELEQHISALDGPLAIDRMLEALCQSGYRERSFPAPPLARYAATWLRVRGRRVSKAVKGRQPGHRNSAEFHDHRFPGTSLAELRERIQRFSKQLGRFDAVVASQLSRHIYLIDT